MSDSSETTPLWTRGRAFFLRQAPVVAADLIGYRLLVREEDGSWTGGVIVETEAYTETDPASHSFRGQTQRNAAMFQTGGALYLYRIYGMHECANVVCAADGVGEAVLIRSLAPEAGIDQMVARRGGRPHRDLCRGPANLVRACGLVLDRDNGSDLLGGSRVRLSEPRSSFRVVSGPRVGISAAIDRPWRFAAADNRYVSASRSRLVDAQ